MTRLAPALLFTLAACAAGVAPPTPRPEPGDVALAGDQFLPADYEGELFVDWAAIRESGLLDRLLRLPMAESMLDVITGPLCDVDDLISCRSAYLTADGQQCSVAVSLLRAGSEPRPAPAEWVPTRIGTRTGYRHGTASTAAVSLLPGPDLVVQGDADLLQRLDDGTAPHGGPHPELAPLLAGDDVLAQFAYGRFGRRYDDALRTFGKWFGDRDDPVDFVRLRLFRAADGALVAAVTLRFARGTIGLEGTEQLARERLDTMLSDPQLAPFRPLLGTVVLARAERDLTASLVLGTPGEAVAKLERAIVALLAHQQRALQAGR